MRTKKEKRRKHKSGPFALRCHCYRDFSATDERFDKFSADETRCFLVILFFYPHFSFDRVRNSVRIFAETAFANLPTELESCPAYRLGGKLCEEEIPEHGNTVTGISTPIATF